MRIIIHLICFIFSVKLAAAPLHEKMKHQIDVFTSIFETRYAMLEWKKERFGVTLEDEAQKAKSAIEALQDPTVQQFQGILKSFFNAFHDYHLSVFFYSTKEAKLPFKVKPVNGKYLVTYIDKQKLPAEIPLSLGDELIIWDGMPVESVIQPLIKAYCCGGNPLTDKALAAQILTQRKGKLGHEVPEDPVKITFVHHHSLAICTYPIPWKTTPEKIIHPINPSFIHKCIFPEFDEEEFANAGIETLGGHKSYVPILGPTIWEAPQGYAFHTYLFYLPHNKVGGYIRIPQFRGGDNEVSTFEQMIAYYEKHTDVLVIDVTNNPGGSPPYADALASMLSPYPLAKLKHKLSLTYHEATIAATSLPILQSATTVEELKKVIKDSRDGLSTDMTMRPFLIDYLTFVEVQWAQGKTLSDPFPIYGVDAIQPHPRTVYTKPLLILTNCLSFSAADFLAALLQDNRRAVIFGERTAGAGGLFQTLTHVNPFGIHNYNITISMAIRDNLPSSWSVYPIENLGVEPDVLYSLTDHDLQCQYESYKKNVIKTLEELIHGTHPAH